MTADEIRQSFLDFFASKDHRIVQSAPVIPHGDPTLLFTNAGMNQFKDVFLGTGTRDYARAADTQKCIRVSGKHNDLEEVGYDTYHHTFFEMLGNWSFGDYYKREAISWAWELLTEVWGLEKRRLHATVFQTDDEAFSLWTELTDIAHDHIHRFGEKDNFWMMGDTGPCGPCSEIHYDRTPDCSGGLRVNMGMPDVIEIWNLVFIQYNRNADGTLTELPAKHVDTGMGFERICAVLQGHASNYDTDLFKPLLRAIQDLSGHRYITELRDRPSIAMRVIADHVRMLAFSIADGAVPGNEGRGYVLRRILRRAARYARNLDLHEPVLHTLVRTLVSAMGGIFPELREHASRIETMIRAEEESFGITLDNGIGIFESIVARIGKQGETRIPGEDAFRLYDTFGFPIDLTELMARERGMNVDHEGFDLLLAEQKQRSREARKTHLEETELPVIDSRTRFTGYEETETEATVVYAAGNQLVLDGTPFYVEAGGQVSDTGRIIVAGSELTVLDVRKNGNTYVHLVDGDVEALAGETAVAVVDGRRRDSIRKNHSATHLLHEALQRVLGSHAKQAGSLVAPDRLRFDFSHYRRISPEELHDIERIVNEKIRENIEVNTESMSIDKARKIPGIKMFFGDKYGDNVRVVTIDESFSREFCGGTHVGRTPEIGLFKIINEGSIASGTRRVEAITAEGIEEYVRSLQAKLEERQREEDVLLERIRNLEKELNTQRLERAQGELENLIAGAREVGNSKIVISEVIVPDLEHLKSLGDTLREKMKSGIGLLATVTDDKVQFVCVVTDDLIRQKGVKAGQIVGEVAKRIGGRGGGKPHLATAGAKDLDKLAGALADAETIIRNALSRGET